MEKYSFERAMRYLKEKTKDVHDYEGTIKIVIELIEKDYLSTAIQILKTLDSTLAEYFFFKADNMVVEMPQPISTREDVEKLIKKVTNQREWIPTKSGFYPEPGENVQVTYISCVGNKPSCDAFAYRTEAGEWAWTHDDTKPLVEIIAWKYEKPYQED